MEEQDPKERIAELEGRIRQLEKRLSIDPDTGLLNKFACLAWLQSRIDGARFPRRDAIRAITCVFVDLNNMGAMNASIGHFAVDNLLVQFARFLESQVHDEDVVGRIHGDEFVMMFPRTNEKDARVVIERIDDALRSATSVVKSDRTGEEVSVQLRAKYGAVTWHRRSVTTADKVFRAMSNAQAEAKQLRALNPDAAAIVIKRFKA